MIKNIIQYIKEIKTSYKRIKQYNRSIQLISERLDLLESILNEMDNSSLPPETKSKIHKMQNQTNDCRHRLTQLKTAVYECNDEATNALCGTLTIIIENMQTDLKNLINQYA